MFKLLSDNEGYIMDEIMKGTIYENESTAAIDKTKRNRMLNDNPEKGTIFVRVYRKDVFGFIRHVDKIKDGLGNSLTMRRANSGKSIYRTIGDETKVESKDIVWYVRRHTPSFYNLSLGHEQIVAKKNTEFHMFQIWFRINLSFRTTIGRWK